MQRYDKLVYTRRLIYAIVVIDAVGEVIRRFLAVFSPLWRQRFPIPVPKRILLLRTEQIGDLVLTTPTFKAVREGFPHAHIAVLVQSRTAPLLKFNRDINEVISCTLPWYEREKHPIRITNPLRRAMAAIRYHWHCIKTVLQLAHQLREKRFDVAVDFGGHIYTLMVMAAARIPVRIGDPRAGGKFLLTHPVTPDDKKHEVERCLEIVSILGVNTLKPQLILNWSHEDEGHVAKLWTRLGLDENRPVIAIHPFSVEPSRCWRPENWAVVADTLVDHFGARVLFIGSAADQVAVSDIQRKMRNQSISLCGELSLLQLAALLRRCDLMIGVNSAPAHIAAAVGIPVVSVWSSAYLPEKWAPYTPKLRVVRKQVPCADCRLIKCPLPISCMDMITPDEVIAAVEEMLTRSKNMGVKG